MNQGGQSDSDGNLPQSDVPKTAPRSHFRLGNRGFGCVKVARRYLLKTFHAIVHWLSASLRWIDSHNGLLTAAATVAIAVLTYYVAQLTSEQGKIATRQLSIIESDERPWISTKIEIIGSLAITDNGAEIRIRYTLENVGKTPAFNVVAFPLIAAAIFPAGPNYIFGPIDPINEVKKACKKYSQSLSDFLDAGFTLLFGNTIFPNKTFTKEETAVIDFPPTIPSSLMISKRQMTGPAFLISCVDYRASAETAHHQTGDAFYLDRRNPDNPSKSIDIDLTTTGVVHQEDLRLIPYALGAYAN